MKQTLIILLLFSCICTHTCAQDMNDWLLEQIMVSSELRHVNYQDMYDKAFQEGSKVNPLVKALVVIDYCRAYGLDSLTTKMIDYVLGTEKSQLLDKSVATYLFDTKFKLMLLQNRYDEIERMASIIDLHWNGNPQLEDWAVRWHQLANKGRYIAPVSIRRERDTVGIAFNKDIHGFMRVDADINQSKKRHLIIDTGLLTSSMLYRDFAEQAGVRLLPFSTTGSSASHPEDVFSMQLGIIDSMRIEGITFYNLPVWVSDEDRLYDCDGFIGTPDLSRLEYIELSNDSIVFRYPLPTDHAEANFTMNAGSKGERCICLPCTIDGEKSSFILDTGSNTFLLPAQYLQQTKEIPVGIGEKEFMMTGSMCHAFVAKADSKGFWGRPLLNMFERLCFNFRDAHVEYVDK